MNEIGHPKDRAGERSHASTVADSSHRPLLSLAIPVAALALAIAWLLFLNPLQPFNNGAPPVENLTFERTILDGEGIHLKVRAGGSEAMSIAQVQVDDAFWSFTQEPPGPLARVGSAWLHIPYPWVHGEAHAVTAVTNTGATFTAEIPVAVATPSGGGAQLLAQAPLGVFVGIVPVAIGLAFFPLMRSAGPRGMEFLLAVTIGLLGFLLIDTMAEAFELAGKAAPAFQGSAMVLLAAGASFLVLFAIGRQGGQPTGVALATYIALGIGLHNFGEGMAIGAAFAAGAAGLGTFLVLGFALHNITEGIGIAAPLVGRRPSVASFFGLAMLAGAPAVLGLWFGSLAWGLQWTALAFAVGAGAIAQVIVEVGAFLLRQSGGGGFTRPSAATVGGLAAGIAVMYATAMLVKI